MASRKDASKTATSRRRLGRGLGSLISGPVAVEIQAPAPEEPPATKALATPAAAPVETKPAARPRGDSPPASDLEITELPVGDVHPNPRQPRQDFDEQALEALASSIRSAGLMQPIVVRPSRAGGFELIAGERRWRAARRVGLTHVPAVIRDVDDRVASEWSLVENLQREDLNPIERAEAFRRLIDEFGLTHQRVAECVGFDRSSVTNHLRLLELESELKELVRAGLLSLGHGRALLALTNIRERTRLAAAAVREGWSVRELERRIKAGRGGAVAPAARPIAPRQANVADLERRLGDFLGTKVAIRSGRKKGAGKLEIAFFSLDEFEGLIRRLGFESM